jgi:hypothetical protein
MNDNWMQTSDVKFDLLQNTAHLSGQGLNKHHRKLKQQQT